ncbi:hypothetical protein K435DRAFT_665523 [Dendrothele bispora CBS 962.96]|uniref:Uncharacterized protein n=1 Tax=Dendrothele bispora (strain CBS 962.96) TaxID=1314807 RepID=A0A4S8M1A7_DENBC|nr:hypothetical protein K435DRAFT_665523 [Dendrothele bispora CBS 962.96]
MADIGGGDEQFHPFSSKLDWQLARWAITEWVSQSSFNKLLEIPEIKEQLGLGFHNTRSMLQKVDDIPEHCGEWMIKQIQFRDRISHGVDETFNVYHQDPVEAVCALWGDPAFVDRLVYCEVLKTLYA